jgi:hypothetical protein
MTTQAPWTQRLRGNYSLEETPRVSLSNNTLEHCAVRNLGEPSFTDVSDRRGLSTMSTLLSSLHEILTGSSLGGRTAWST